MEMGMPRVAHIGGGFTAWKEAGGPVADKAARKPAVKPVDAGGA
jgi:3-mercaptopyruvate sulfurtransferase SseA